MHLLLAMALASPPADQTSDDAAAPALPAELELPVVGGSPAVQGTWPDVAAIHYDDRVSCTGVLIHSRWVLTAGHCPSGATDVYLDTVDYDAPEEVIPVVREIRHPDHLVSLDLMLLELARDAQTPPRALAPPCFANVYLAEGAPVAIAGYGAIEVEPQYVYETVLHEGYTEVIDPDCSEHMDQGCDEVFDNPGLEFVAGGDGVDTCVGDSGGPAYLLTDRGDVLAGITSRGLTRASVDCGDGGIYVRTDVALTWIQEIANITLQGPSCEGLNQPPDPSAPPLATTMGLAGTAILEAGDPDVDDEHTFRIIAPPAHGDAIVDGEGVITYQPDDLFYVGPDLIEVEVTDNGSPPLSRSVFVPVEVTEAPGVEHRGSCATVGYGPGWLLLLPLLARRRWSS